MKIIDINGNERNAVSIKKMIDKVPDMVNEGEFIDEHFVEVEIKGRHRKGTWIEWYPLDDFIKMNPTIIQIPE